MNASSLPAHLQGYQPRLTERAVAGLGTALPPHISIRSNRFTLIDGAGARHELQEIFLDACIFDISDVTCKRYYERDYEPDSNEPPTCFSMNGVAPSREAATPQSNTCATCDWNVRGSDTSKLTGKGIKACRDEKALALALPRFPGMLFQLILTPGSFKNWRDFNKLFEGQSIDMAAVITQITFESNKNGVLQFKATGYVDEPTYASCRKALAEKLSDALVGRNDVPWQGQLAAPTGTTQPGLAPATQHPPAAFQPAPAPTFALPGASTAPFAPAAGPAQSAAFLSTGTASAPMAAPTTASQAIAPSAAAPSDGRRKRRTKAEMQAAQQAQPAGQAPVAPFRPAPAEPLLPFSQPGTPSFGMAPSVAPNPEMVAAIDKAFGKA